MPKMLPDVPLNKFGMAMNLSAEVFYSLLSGKDPRYERKCKRIEAAPTPEAWARYYQALAGLRALEAYEGTDWGGPEYGTEVYKPSPTVTYEYLETTEEWLARCRALREENVT